MGDGGRSGQGQRVDAGAEGAGAQAGEPLRLREVPGILLALLGLAAAMGASAAVIHFVLGFNWLASFAAAPLLLMAATVVWRAARKRREASPEATETAYGRCTRSPAAWQELQPP